MEHSDAASHSLPDVGSFSYSWPASRPAHRLDERRAAFVGTDDPASSRHSFDFRLPPTEAELADADVVFLDGVLRPLPLVSHGDEGGSTLMRSLSLDSSRRMIASESESKRHRRLSRPASLSSSPSSGLCGRGTIVPTKPPTSTSRPSGGVIRATKLWLPSFGRRRRQRKLPSRYLGFLAPLCQKIVGCIRRRKAMETPTDAPHRPDHGSSGKVRDLGQEDAIRDAIVHCKRCL